MIESKEKKERQGDLADRRPTENMSQRTPTGDSPQSVPVGAWATSRRQGPATERTRGEGHGELRVPRHVWVGVAWWGGWRSAAMGGVSGASLRGGLRCCQWCL